MRGSKLSEVEPVHPGGFGEQLFMNTVPLVIAAFGVVSACDQRGPYRRTCNVTLSSIKWKFSSVVGPGREGKGRGSVVGSISPTQDCLCSSVMSETKRCF